MTPNGTAMTSATIETRIDPTSNGMIPYQSCQKLAVTHSRPKRKELIERYHGIGESGDQVRNFSEAAGNPARYSRVRVFHCSNAFCPAGSGNDVACARRL